MSFVFGAAGIILTVLALACVGGLEVLRETASENGTESQDRPVASRLTRRQLFVALVVLTALLLAQLVARIAHFT